MVKTLDHHRKAFAKHYVTTGNAVESLRKVHPELVDKPYSYIGLRANRMINNDKVKSAIDEQRAELEKLAGRAVNVVGELLESENETIRSQNAWKVIEQTHGKAMQKSMNLNVNMDLESALSDL